MDIGLLTLLNQTITLAPATGLDGYGKATYGTAVSVPALVEQRLKMIRDAQGREVVSSTQAFVDGTTVVTTESKITLPDGSTPVILAVASMPDVDGTIYSKVIYT